MRGKGDGKSKVVNGLRVGCVRPREAEDPVRPKDERQEDKEEWGKEQNNGRRGRRN